ncbi:MAG: type 1 glutamine amidotransferase [Ginsengibacter sp.]
MHQLRIHYFQHVPFEGPGSIQEWSIKNGHSLTSTNFYINETPPDLNSIDWLIIMGGPMSVDDEKEFRWLPKEKSFIKNAIEKGKTVIGICLGAQLIAQILGAKVYPNKQKEIGWFPIRLTESAKQHPLFNGLNSEITVFHWHGDTFELPENAIALAKSAACNNQGFIFNQNVLALQFHLETTRQGIQQMIENGRHELTRGQYIQQEKEIENQQELFKTNKEFLFSILDRLTKINDKLP